MVTAAVIVVVVVGALMIGIALSREIDDDEAVDAPILCAVRILTTKVLSP